MGQITQVNPEALNVASQMILKEIDLTGTDAERKAKLDQFEADWRALTGANGLSGARFMGIIDYNGNHYSGIMNYCTNRNDFFGGTFRSDTTPDMIDVCVSFNSGSFIITPLFQHLEAVTIQIGSTDAIKLANKTAIEGYVNNLKALGVDTSKGFLIPVLGNSLNGYITPANAQLNYYSGVVAISGTRYFLSIGGEYNTVLAEILNSNSLYLKYNAKSLEAVTIKTSNSDADKAANVAAIKAYVDNLKSLGVDVTKGYCMPIQDGTTGGVLTLSPKDDLLRGEFYSDSETMCFIGVNITSGGVFMNSPILGRTTALTTTSKQIVGAINEVNALAKGVKALGAIELKADDKAANKTALAAFLKVLTDAGIDTSNGYSTPIRITGNSQEYFGTLNIGTGTLLSGVVTDINESHHYPCNVNISDGELTFSETNYFLEKTSNEVVEMLDAIKYSYTPVPFTETTLSNKAQLEVFLSKVPDAQVMHCTYKGVYAGTLHKINGDWFGLLVKNTNDYADNLNVKLQADGTLIEGTTSVQSINAQLDAINGEVK